MKKKNRTAKISRITKKKATGSGRLPDLHIAIIILVLVPIFFAGIFQGGYFPWEVYATLLLSIPAVSIFVYYKLKNRDGLAKSGADRGLFAFLVVVFLSLFFTVYFHATLAEFYKTLTYLALFYILFDTVKSRKEFLLFLNAVLMLGLLLAVSGIVAYAGIHFHLAGGIFSFLARNGFVQGNRLASSLQYANTFAAFLILEFFVAFSLTINAGGVKLKVVYGIISLVFLVSLLLTESRGGLIAFLLSWILFLTILGGEKRKEGLVYTGILFGIFILFALLDRNLLLPILKNLGSRMVALLDFINGSKNISLGARESMIKDGIKILKAYPVLGTGAGTYQYVYMRFRSVYLFSKFPHSFFFQVLDELGILGGAAFLYMLYGLFSKGIKITLKNRDSAVFAGLFAGISGLLLHALVDFDWSLMFMPFLFFAGFGALMSFGKTGKSSLADLLVFRKKAVSALRKKQSRRASHAWNPVFVSAVVSIVLFMLFIFPFSAARADFDANAGEGKVSWQQTVSQYETAVALDPICSEYHYDLAHFYFTKIIPASPNPGVFVSKAISQYEAAIKHCPEFFLYHFELARLYLQTGNKKAIEEFTKAVELNPIDPGGHAALGFAYLQLKGDTVMAETQFEEALKLNPRNSDAHLGMGKLYEKLGKTDKAIKEYELAVRYNRKSAYAYYRLGVLLERQGRIPEAVRNLFFAVKYNPALTDAKKEFEKYGSLVSVIKPSGSRVFGPGNDCTIAWTASAPEKVKSYEIWLVPSRGRQIPIVKGLTGGTFTFVWHVSENISPGKYKIRVYTMNSDIMKNSKIGNWISFGDSPQITIEK